jgi:hypothetical protein
MRMLESGAKLATLPCSPENAALKGKSLASPVGRRRHIPAD